MKRLGLLCLGAGLLPLVTHAQGGCLLLQPDQMTNSVVLAGGSLARSMVVSNTGEEEIGFSFSRPFEPHDDSLIAYYPFNGNADDESGNGHDGTVSGAMLTTDRFGKPDSAFAFDGIDDAIRVRDAVPLRLANTDYTISTWFYGTATNSSFHNVLVTKRGRNSSNGWFYSVTARTLGSPGPDYIFMQISAGLDPKANSQNKVAMHAWNHAAITYDLASKKVSIYVNGKLDAVVGNIPSPNPLTMDDMVIGLDSALSTYGFSGKIDDVRIYKRALSAGEVAGLFNGVVENPPCPLPDWLAVVPLEGAIAAGSNVEVAVTFLATNRVAGDFASHGLALYSSGKECPEQEIPLSMWVAPSSPVIMDEPHCSFGKANELAWTGQGGPVQYWLEGIAIEHCAPANGLCCDAGHGKPVPPGWANTNRFSGDPELWNRLSGWIASTNHIFYDLCLNTKYQYRVKAGVATGIGWLESTWSAPVASCQIPHVRNGRAIVVPAGWTERYFGPAENIDLHGDSDGDGLCDLDEYITGHDPRNGRSAFTLHGRKDGLGAGYVLEWDSVPGRKYNIYWSPSLTEAFQLIAGEVRYPQKEFIHAIQDGSSGGFYRIEVLLDE